MFRILSTRSSVSVFVAFALSAALPAHGAETDEVWLDKLDSSQSLEAGQVVGLFGNGLSLSTAGADRVFVIGTAPVGQGRAGGAPVMATGEAAIEVAGPTRAGDLLFASGRNDGTAAGKLPSEITPGDLRRLVGRALEPNPTSGTRKVRAIVGLSEREALAELLETRDALLEAQEVELTALRAQVTALEAMATQVEELRRALSTLEALEAARKARELAPLPLDADED